MYEYLETFWIGSSGDWLSRRPRLAQGCSARRMDGLGNFGRIGITTEPNDRKHFVNLMCP